MLHAYPKHLAVSFSSAATKFTKSSWGALFKKATWLLKVLLFFASAAALSGCSIKPRVLYFTPSQANDYGICGKPAPPGDATREFTANERKYKMLWVKGTMCEFSNKGAFLQSYTWGTNPANATHVYVDRSGVLQEELSFGPIANTATGEQIGRAAWMDTAGLAAVIAAAGLIGFISMRRKKGASQSSHHAGLASSPAILLEDNVYPSLDVVRALGAGAVLGAINCFPMNVIDPQRSQSEMKKLLDDSWYIYSADDLEFQFNSLLDRGHAYSFDWLIAMSLRAEQNEPSPEQIKEYFNEPTEYAESAANLGPAVQWLRDNGFITSDDDLRRGSSGYDIDRAVMLIRAGLGAGYISRRQALNMVLFAGDHARERFGSWREFATSLLLGRAIWGGVHDAHGQFAERVAVVEMLLTDKNSPWLTAGWWPPRDDDTGDFFENDEAPLDRV